MITRDGARAFDLAENDALRALARGNLANARHHLESMAYLADEDADCTADDYQKRADALRVEIDRVVVDAAGTSD